MNNIKNNYNISFGHKKIPRFVYHFTRQRLYEIMLSDGYLRAMNIDSYMEKPAVFAVDLQRFFKNWGFHKAWNNTFQPEPLYESLIMKVAYPDDLFSSWLNKFAILKIPTKILDKNKLKIRSQKTFFEQVHSENPLEIKDVKILEHMRGTTSACKSRLFNNRKEAIEYVYFDNIPIEHVEKLNIFVGEPIILDKENKYKNLLMNLLKDTPQANELRFLK